MCRRSCFTRIDAFCRYQEEEEEEKDRLVVFRIYKERETLGNFDCQPCLSCSLVREVKRSGWQRCVYIRSIL
ncbi:hypothetical protein E2C01_081630 [Portunus trituberculatus]|uniref:Uncharacterized protein n=1 Tax=Portunus trituberculatus TaxID=210409 RepID=A0A5B7IX13_PORTR|nr:hypothetical protein [Portunus trituberculatus]